MGLMTRRAGGMLAVGAIVALAAGCSSGGTSSAPAGTASTASAAGSSASSAGASGGSSAGATPSGGSSGTGTSGTGTSGAATSTASAAATKGGPPACATSDLKATIVNTQGAAGSTYENIDFTNTGTTTCSLYGYPGVSLGTGLPFKQVGAAATRAAGTPALVSLAPGKTANAQLRVVDALNFPAATCKPTKVSYLQVFPPNQKAALDLPFKSTGCAATSVKVLTIGVVQAGTGSNG